MKPYGILKLTVGNKARTMHYTTFDNQIVLLTLNDSNKIRDIKNDNNILIEIKDTEPMEGTVKINTNKNTIKTIFNQMLEEKSTHFKTFDDKIVVLELSVK